MMEITLVILSIAVLLLLFRNIKLRFSLFELKSDVFRLEDKADRLKAHLKSSEETVKHYENRIVNIIKKADGVFESFRRV